MTTVDAYSLAAVPVQQLANNTPMKNATAFVWIRDKQHYLVTNWHVISGRDARTGELVVQARPDTLRALFNVRVGQFGKQQHDIRIRDDAGKPLWFVYPGRGRSVDVAVLPIPMTGAEPVMNMYPINTLPADDLAVRIGMEVFILGYPFGAPPPAFPVWKRGSVASDISLHRTKCTRLGMVWTLLVMGGTVKRLHILAHRSVLACHRTPRTCSGSPSQRSHRKKTM